MDGLIFQKIIYSSGGYEMSHYKYQYADDVDKLFTEL